MSCQPASSRILKVTDISSFLLPWISLLATLDESARDADADQQHGEEE
jgi:hypothetical protein